MLTPDHKAKLTNDLQFNNIHMRLDSSMTSISGSYLSKGSTGES